MTHEVPGLEGFKWQSAYGAFTSKGALDSVEWYVLNKKRHHADDDLWVEWEQCQIPDPPQPT
jgi:hypothetical protein